MSIYEARGNLDLLHNKGILAYGYVGIFFELVRKRRSIRKYRREPVEEEKIERMLEAARLAPSANNSQAWHFIAIRDKKIEALSRAAPQVRDSSYHGYPALLSYSL